MKILIACEESQTICKEFRKRGHECYSCDIVECSGGFPEWHIMQDVLPLLNGNCAFITMDGEKHTITGKWDLIIAHPPCTYLTITGNRWFNVERYGEKAKQRIKNREYAFEFFMKFVNADCEKIAIENPVGYVGSRYRKADQIIQPYFFGDPYRKKTCLWLKNLPKLKPTKLVEPEVYYYKAKNGKIKSDSRYRSKYKTEERSKHRSKTFEGVAKAIVEQWSENEL